MPASPPAPSLDAPPHPAARCGGWEGPWGGTPAPEIGSRTRTREPPPQAAPPTRQLGTQRPRDVPPHPCPSPGCGDPPTHNSPGPETPPRRCAPLRPLPRPPPGPGPLISERPPRAPRSRPRPHRAPLGVYSQRGQGSFRGAACPARGGRTPPMRRGAVGCAAAAGRRGGRGCGPRVRPPPRSGMGRGPRSCRGRRRPPSPRPAAAFLRAFPLPSSFPAAGLPAAPASRTPSAGRALSPHPPPPGPGPGPGPRLGRCGSDRPGAAESGGDRSGILMWRGSEGGRREGEGGAGRGGEGREGQRRRGSGRGGSAGRENEGGDG